MNKILRFYAYLFYFYYDMGFLCEFSIQVHCYVSQSVQGKIGGDKGKFRVSGNWLYICPQM